MEKLVVLRPEAKKKVDDLFKEMQREMWKLTFKGAGIAIASALPITFIAIAAGLEKTSFPMVLGLATWILINVRYLNPVTKEIGEHYGKEIKAVVEDERRSQAEESGLAGD